MASAPAVTAAAVSGDVVVPRPRGKSKARNVEHEGPVAVIRLELDARDDGMRHRLEKHWEAAFRLRRAAQRDAAARCRAYWAAHHERERGAKALRDRLGLTREGIEDAARAHIEASGWMADHLTQASGLHMASEVVWQTVARHLFADKSGHRHGPPRIGPWDFTRTPARSHTEPQPTWKTYWLAGSALAPLRVSS
jgi:hypothetical protein